MALQPNWTNEEDQTLRQHWGVITAKQIDERRLLPGRTLKGIRSRSKTLKLRSKIRAITHTFNESFWKAPNHTNAYWAGEMASDGCLMKLNGKNETYVLQLSIAVRDIDHLAKFKAAIAYSGPIKTQESDCPLSTRDPTAKHTMCYIRICQMRKCEQDLREIWGIVPHKTRIISPPALSGNVLRLCYIAGYIDGDGAISADYHRGRPCLSFTSCSQTILSWFAEVFGELFAVAIWVKPPSEPRPRDENENCWGYSVSGFRALKIIDIMSRLPVPKMDRKWKNPRILAIMERYKARYPVEWTRRLPIEDEIDAYLASLPAAPAQSTLTPPISL